MKIFRKIRHQLLRENIISKYLFYAVGEIILVVIGILIALQINNWNTERIKRNVENQYYQNIKRQINEDKQEIIGCINYNNKRLKLFNFGTQIIEKNDRSKLDTLGSIALKLTDYSDFLRQGNIYETMVNSGEIKLLNNTAIVEEIRRLEEKYIYINKLEEIHRDLVLNMIVKDLSDIFKLATREVRQEEEIFSIKFQNVIVVFVSIMDEKDEVYNEALDKIQEITELIDKELDIEN